MLEEGHHVADRHCHAAAVIDRHILVGAVKVLAVRHAERQRCGFVYGPLHLVDVPVGAEQRGVHYPDVGPDTFNFLGVPEREGVVVAVGHDDAVLPDGVEVVACQLDCGAAV